MTFSRPVTNRRLILILVRVHVPKPRKLDPVGYGQPLKVEHRVDRLNLDPPAALLQRESDDVRVVAVANDKLVAVLNVCVLEGDLADGALEDVGVAALALLKALLGSFLVGLELQRVELV